jgi:CheY-like chemotaxis protein
VTFQRAATGAATIDGGEVSCVVPKPMRLGLATVHRQSVCSVAHIPKRYTSTTLEIHWWNGQYARIKRVPCWMIAKSLRVVSSRDATRPTLRILIADDDRDTSLTLATILRTEGHEAHIVLRGDEVLALDRFIRPDVLILDINLPGASGYAVARDIRERRGPGIGPLLIAVSGKWTKPSEKLLGTAVGFDHYLVKPCDPQEIVRLLEPLRTADSSASGGN